MSHDPKAVEELARLGNLALCDRLRGLYRIPVNDGAGPLNGSTEFVRQFETGPIQHEAASRIEALLALMDKALERLNDGDVKGAVEALS